MHNRIDSLLWSVLRNPDEVCLTDHRFNLFFFLFFLSFPTSTNETAAVKPFEGNVASTNCLVSGKEMRFFNANALNLLLLPDRAMFGRNSMGTFAI